MAKTKITLYVDIVSPFGYMAYYMLRVDFGKAMAQGSVLHLSCSTLIGFHIGPMCIAFGVSGVGKVFHPLSMKALTKTALQHSKVFAPCDIKYVPIFLGGLMKMCDNKAPIEIKNKGNWINAERRRWATQFRIPMVNDAPEGFPPLTLSTQRALCALELASPKSIPTALDALYASFWRDGNHLIGKPEGFGPVLEKALGEDVAKDMLERMGGKEAKARLSENTDKAMSLGAFGIPWYECENERGETECFWGFDHLGQVVRFLELDGTVEVDEGFKEGMRAML